MSGENSKNSGEIGEKLSDAFLDAIGWASKISSLSIKCNNQTHKTASDDQRRSHGNDRVCIYNSPFCDSKTDIVHISVKNSLNGYPENESDLKRAFKEHLEEANEIIACAQYDEKLTDLLSGFKSKKHKEHSGLLIWTSSDNSSVDRNILSVIKNTKAINESCKKNIYFIDGARMHFLIKIINHISNEKDINFEFYYPETGNLVNRLDERHGSILPLELMISDVIPLKITRENKEILCIYVNQKFERDCYKRLLSLALGFTGAWSKEIRIGFPDYNAAHHKNEAIAAELPFADRKKSFTPFCFTPSILNALEENHV